MSGRHERGRGRGRSPREQSNGHRGGRGVGQRGAGPGRSGNWSRYKSPRHPQQDDRRGRQRHFGPDPGRPLPRSQISRNEVNGQPGAESHTVSESNRIQFAKMLNEMRENPSVERIEMPSNLTNTERKFIHQIAAQLGLDTKSSGKGENRSIAIFKKAAKKKIAGSGGDVNEGDSDEAFYPYLEVGKSGKYALQQHLRNFPPTSDQKKESYETGSSVLDSLLSNANNSAPSHQEPESIKIDEDAQIQHAHLFESCHDNNNEDENNKQAEKMKNGPDNFPPSKKVADTLSTHTKPAFNPSIIRRIRFHESAQKTKSAHSNYPAVLKQRKKLPAFLFRDDVCNAVSSNPVTVLSGETGCGKSTQVPQFLLDDVRIGPTASIIVTQPRRISAISLAERVASERCEEVGRTVGYNVRLEGASSPGETQLLFVTPGVLLRKLSTDPNAQEYTHIIIDEIHERDRFTDFLMITLRDLLFRRSDLRLVLMSATIQTDALVSYWTGIPFSSPQQSIPVPTTCPDDGEPRTETTQHDSRPGEIHIPGRTFPVQEFFLEDVLSMTGFVNSQDNSMGMEGLESDLLRLIENKHKSNQKKFHSSGRKPPQKVGERPLISNLTSLTCVMCGQAGFRTPEELGTHVALCDGGGAATAEQLEEKVRGINPDIFAGFDVGVTVDESEIAKRNDEEGDNTMEHFNQDDDDDDPDVVQGKWDGENLLVTDTMQSVTSQTTLTEEEMLRRYQSAHDDEQIDYDLLLELTQYIVQSSYGAGAILMFLPGWAEISEFSIVLETTRPFSDRTKYLILPLHSGIPSKEQRRVFATPPKGVRKIILATNIAETSITIDDVVFVVDTGRVKEKNYDPHLKTSTLQPVWVSQASAKQRKGRAGRTKAGVCFHLYSRRRFASFHPFSESELLRTPLEEMCLQCKKLGVAPGRQDDVDGIPSFLGKALTPPHPKAVTNAIELLVKLGAMEDETNELTDLGYCLSALSLEPRVGKMVIWSYLLGCSKSVASMGVAMSYKSPYILPPRSLRQAADKAMVELSEQSESDQITVLNILQNRHNFFRKGQQGAFVDYCRKKFLSHSTIQMIADLRRNVSSELCSLGFPSPEDSGLHNQNDRFDPAFLQAAIAAGLYPNIASRRRGEMNFSTMTNRKAKIHISSVNSCKGQPLSEKCRVSKGDVEFVVYGEMVRGVMSFTMNQTTHLASSLPLVLLCGELRVRPATKVGVLPDGSGPTMAVISVDDWIVFLCDREVAAGLVLLRSRLNDAFWSMVADPSLGFGSLNDVEMDAIETLGVVLKSGYQRAVAG